jgi:DNA helicase-2/ATP-dependent DNA helicase PcrA
MRSKEVGNASSLPIHLKGNSMTFNPTERAIARNTTNFQPTDEQMEATKIVRANDSSLMLDAMAGTGKTTTLAMLAKEVRGSGMALAFNKSIATTLASRFPSNFDVRTMNSLGYGALRRALPGVQKWEIDPRKLGKIITQIAKDKKWRITTEQWDGTRKIVSHAMLLGLMPGGSGLTEDTPEIWEEIASECWVDSKEEEVMELAYLSLVENNRVIEKGQISFDDQIYWPIASGLKGWSKFDVVMVDEAQDLNTLQHAMLEKLLHQDSRLIVCGDPRQSIYAFRGAHSNSMGQIRSRREVWRDQGLTLTFRCPKKVVERQQKHAPGYRAAPSNVDGQFNQFGIQWDFEIFKSYWPSEKPTIAILCRNNAPLFSMAFKLLRSNIGVMMLGSEIGKGLIGLTKKLANEDNTPIGQFLGKLHDWRLEEVDRAEKSDADHRIDGIHDRAESLIAIVDGTGAKDAGQLRVHLQRLFDRREGLVTLATAHKAKGLEWDVVLHLDPWRVPSKMAIKSSLKDNGLGLRQEANIKYVLETRTKHTLIEANLEDFEI